MREADYAAIARGVAAQILNKQGGTSERLLLCLINPSLMISIGVLLLSALLIMRIVCLRQQRLK